MCGRLYKNIITEIKVSWYGRGSNGTRVFAGDRRNFNVSGLLANEAYTFRVQARNLNVDGYESGVTIVGTPETTPPDSS